MPLSEEVTMTAAENTAHGHDIMRLLFEQKGELPISENAVRAAAKNSHCGYGVLTFLLDQTKSSQYQT
ncbi:hypothetical protein ASPWEDRAFT_34377, partial [Aspergillus wentii DTO 134E9]